MHISFTVRKLQPAYKKRIYIRLQKVKQNYVFVHQGKNLTNQSIIIQAKLLVMEIQ